MNVWMSQLSIETLTAKSKEGRNKARSKGLKVSVRSYWPGPCSLLSLCSITDIGLNNFT
jgi:hypothetical protein